MSDSKANTPSVQTATATNDSVAPTSTDGGSKYDVVEITHPSGRKINDPQLEAYLNTLKLTLDPNSNNEASDQETSERSNQDTAANAEQDGSQQNSPNCMSM